MKNITLSLLLIAFCSYGQTQKIVTKKLNENILIVDEGQAPPTDPACNCPAEIFEIRNVTLSPVPSVTLTKINGKWLFDFALVQGPKGNDGRGISNAAVDPTTGILTITYTDGTKYISSSLTGPPGTCPNCPPIGGSGTMKGFFDVTTYGANGNDNIDDVPFFQRAWNDALAAGGGTIVIPPTTGAYRFNSTWNCVPDASNQAWNDILAMGKAGSIKYFGPAGTVAVRVIGLKGGDWRGLNVELMSDGQIAFDIDGTPSAESSSFNTFTAFYVSAPRANQIGFRLGHTSGGNGHTDISNYKFTSCVVFGNMGGVQSGGVAYLVEGVNTLSNVWDNCFTAFMDKHYSNVSKVGTGSQSDRGNGSVFFLGQGCSQNNLDFEIAWEQQYMIDGMRGEGGKKLCRVVAGGYSSVTFQNCQVHDYVRGGNIIEALTSTSISLINTQITNTASDGPKPYNPAIALNSNGYKGVLFIQGGGYSSTQLYNKTGTTEWDVTVLGVPQVRIQRADAFFNNEIGKRIP